MARYAERRGLDPLRPHSEIVVQRQEPEQGAKPPVPIRMPEPPAERTVQAEPSSRPAPDLAQAAAAGRAGFRERFEAHKRQQAQTRDEAAARMLVGQWDRLLAAYNVALPQMEADPALGGARERLAQFGRGVGEQPGATRVLREQGEAFGMAERPNLARIVADREPERVVAGIMAAAEDGMRAHLATAREAEREATRQREAQAPRPSRGMSMGM